MTERVEIAPHPWHGARQRAAILFEWSDEDAFTFQIAVEDAEPRENEGAIVQVDHGMCGLTIGGAASFMAAVVMTPDEAKAVHAALGKVLAE